MQFGKYKLKLCKYGWMMFAGPYIGECFDLYGQFSESEVSVLRYFVKPGDTVIDVGAYFGDLTLPMSQLVGGTGRVFAVESNLHVYHALCANLALNGIENVKALNCFLAQSKDVDTASPQWGKFAYVSERWGADITSLDSLGIDTCSFIKIDVDGKELEVLKSGENLINQSRPVIYFENDIKSESPALLGHLMDMDYNLYWHAAPYFDPDNFFGNQVNKWAPQNMASLMVLAVPGEKPPDGNIGLTKINSRDEWWNLSGQPG
jgi:FkbM family methyltransferase